MTINKEEYTKYINSAKWKKIRAEKIARGNGLCEICGISKWSVKLEVHHKHYRNFKNENMDDLQVLCPKCHEKADKNREKDTEKNNSRKLYDARLNGWAVKVYGEYWQNLDVERIQEEFELFLERQSYS